MKRSYNFGSVLLCCALMAATGTAVADDESEGKGNNSCAGLPNYTALKNALTTAVGAESSGLNLQMWGTIVDRDGVVCAVAFSGTDRGAQWPGSRVISAQKANTANAFSLDSSSDSSGSGAAAGLALSTANLYSAVQPGGSLFGLQFSNPVDPAVAYKGPSSRYGTSNDPMVGAKPGGVNVFGGASHCMLRARKSSARSRVSGDTSCADPQYRLASSQFAGVRSYEKPAWAEFRAILPARTSIIFDITDNPNRARELALEDSDTQRVLNPPGSSTLPVVQQKSSTKVRLRIGVAFALTVILGD